MCVKVCVILLVRKVPMYLNINLLRWFLISGIWSYFEFHCTRIEKNANYFSVFSNQCKSEEFWFDCFCYPPPWPPLYREKINKKYKHSKQRDLENYRMTFILYSCIYKQKQKKYWLIHMFSKQSIKIYGPNYQGSKEAV